jgi:group I intron endonuclease
MYINHALLKDGYSNFSLEILIYCSPEELLIKEDYFFKLLKPKYNILPTAGSPLGSKKSEEIKNKIRESIKGSKHPNYGKAISLETKKRISEARKGQRFGSAIGISVEVIDLETNEKTNLRFRSPSSRGTWYFPHYYF